MKKVLFSFLLAMSFATVRSQETYKILLDSFYHHAENSFKDIIGEQTDIESIFYPSKLKPDIGEAKIGKYPNAVTLNWIIPLSQSKNAQLAVQSFVKTTYSDNKLFKILIDGTEDEGYITTNVYALNTAKPLLIFQTVYYKSSENPNKSQFVITIYGK